MIKDKELFTYIIKKGHYNKDKYYVVYSVENKENVFPHFGIAVRNKLGHAVVRNRIKRQTRSIIDNNRNLFKKDRDYIIMIRDGCLDGNFKDMNDSLANLLKGKNR